MKRLQCLIATTQRQLDDALRVRWTVFASELGLIAPHTTPAPREVHCLDTLETTVHFVVYADDKPVATTRLLLPNAEVARATGHPLGLDLEQKLDLSPLRGLAVAETTRYCTLRAWRGSEAVVLLNAALYHESRRRGVTHWVACANTETDVLEDARLALHVARSQELVSPHWRVQPWHTPQGPEAPEAPLYSPQQRLAAQAGALQALKLPRTLSLFARKLGARFIGEPLYDLHFRRYAVPLVAALSDIPASTLALFRTGEDSPLRAA